MQLKLAALNILFPHEGHLRHTGIIIINNSNNNNNNNETIWPAQNPDLDLVLHLLDMCLALFPNITVVAEQEKIPAAVFQNVQESMEPESLTHSSRSVCMAVEWHIQVSVSSVWLSSCDANLVWKMFTVYTGNFQTFMQTRSGAQKQPLVK